MTPARERLLVVVGAVAAGAAAVTAATQPFATATVAGGQAPITITGQQASPALAPLGIVALALALALTIAGRIARPVLGVLLVLLGAGVIAAAMPSVLDPSAGTAGVIDAATGTTDTAASVTGRTATAWPEVGVVAGALAALLGLVVLVRGHRWSTGGRRYSRTPRPIDPTDPISEWDAQSRGADPTGLDDR